MTDFPIASGSQSVVPRGALRWAWLVASLVTSASWACGDDDAIGEGGDGICVPGDTRACVGPGACMGGQSCRDDRTGYEPCECGGAPDEAQADGGADSGGGSEGSGNAGRGGGGAGKGGAPGSSDGGAPQSQDGGASTQPDDAGTDAGADASTTTPPTKATLRVSWTIVNMASAQLACVAVPDEDGVEILVTSSGTTDLTSTLEDCEPGEADVTELAFGEYTVSASLLDGSGLALGSAPMTTVTLADDDCDAIVGDACVHELSVEIELD